MPEEEQDTRFTAKNITDEQMEEIKRGEYMSVGEIADKLRYSYQWVLWNLKQGRIKAIKPLGKRWLIPKSEFDHILKHGVLPWPEKEKPKPHVTEVIVEDKKVMDKIAEPEKKQEPSSSTLFGIDFSPLFGGKKQ